ncbi:hypothetical protein RJ639_004398 [Escallonia herrerae]|uniref:Methionine aminopeptidase n=1 Tax=Escallonia herrerae TaxID=1293975 RepID=A0AA88W2H1_9ASTE|nr:hypothetical protein RJ639_004398 [Escallonia herrerae]
MAGGGSSDVAESSLSCARCGKPANLQCPKCVELKLPREGAAFCTQDCFKASWSSHKSVHAKAKFSAPGSGNTDGPLGSDDWLYCLKKGQARTPKLPNFEWTGTLRPYPISKKRLVPNQIDQPDWAIDIKTSEQIGRMRETCRIGREVLDAAARAIRPGVTTDEIDAVVHEATIAAVQSGQLIGLSVNMPQDSSGKNVAFEDIHLLSIITFSPSLAARRSVNEVICHGIPDARKLEDGDIVNVDVSVYYKGVHGDLNETFFVGNVDEASQKLVQCTYECLEKAISIVKPGVRFREVGEVISRHASMSGLSVAKSYCGHGIGELFHCAPNIPHYARNKAVGVMKAGQTFSIEPMINSGVWRDRMWPDGWTDVTADGKRSAQFEHTLLVTETGVEVLTARLPTSPNVFPWLKS